MRILFVGLGIAAILGTAAAFAQDSLPAGPGRAETIKACSACHGLDIFQGARRSAAGWETTVNNMVAAGAPMSDEEFDIVVTYLTTYLGLNPSPATRPAESASAAAGPAASP